MTDTTKTTMTYSRYSARTRQTHDFSLTWEIFDTPMTFAGMTIGAKADTDGASMKVAESEEAARTEFESDCENAITAAEKSARDRRRFAAMTFKFDTVWMPALESLSAGKLATLRSLMGYHSLSPAMIREYDESLDRTAAVKALLADKVTDTKSLWATVTAALRTAEKDAYSSWNGTPDEFITENADDVAIRMLDYVTKRSN